MHICFIVEGYPCKNDPFMPFIRNTVGELAKRGIKCSVVCPQGIMRAIRYHVPIRKNKWRDYVDTEHFIDVYQPIYFTLPGIGQRLNKLFFFKAAKRAYKQIDEKIDVLYGHFWHMGMIASKIDSSKPVIVACGESKISVTNTYRTEEIESLLKQVKGVIYVSTKSQNESSELGLQRNVPKIVLPNGFDEKLFRVLDKNECRAKLKWEKEWAVVVFVGSFIERKGVLRLNQALENLNRPNEIKACFIGSGDQEPNYEGIIHCGKVEHDKLTEYLCASDFFVLPTTNEGCCNAIVEALACGLPVVSSKEGFNDDILNNFNSIRIDSTNVGEIQNAIECLVDDTHKRSILIDGALISVKDFTLRNRAIQIEKFIEGCITIEVNENDK